MGLKPQVAPSPNRRCGEIEYNQSLQTAWRCSAGLDESALRRVYDERLKLSPGAEVLLAAAKEHGIKTAGVGRLYPCHRTGQTLPRPRLYLFKHARVAGHAHRRDRRRIVNADAKHDELLRVSESLGIKREQIIGMGDGANDLLMAECGVTSPITPNRSRQTTHA